MKRAGGTGDKPTKEERAFLAKSVRMVADRIESGEITMFSCVAFEAKGQYQLIVVQGNPEAIMAMIGALQVQTFELTAQCMELRQELSEKENRPPASSHGTITH